MARGEETEFVIDKPNRRKSSSKATRAVVVLLLVVSIVLMAIVTVGGWGQLRGAKPLQVFYILIYLVMAFFILRWNRGLLTLAAALAIVLGIFAAIAGPGWFERDKEGFSTPGSLFGGTGLDESVLGLVTLLLVPVQLLLIAFSMQAFRQGWNVEVEIPRDEYDRGRRGGDEDRPGRPNPQPA